MQMVSFKRKEIVGIRSTKFLENINKFTDPSMKPKHNYSLSQQNIVF